MATNDFLVFGGGAGANVITQVTYSGLAARTAGFSAGVAQSAQLNKVWRQSSIMAAVLAQFISDRTGQDALDDGTTAALLLNLKASAAAVNGDSTKTFSVAPATQSQHAMQLGQFLGSNQSFSASGYQKLPGGLILQWVSGSTASGTVTVTLPIAFPNAALNYVVGESNAISWGTSNFTVYGVASVSVNQATIKSVQWNGTSWVNSSGTFKAFFLGY